ncbi:hypothetical protein H0H93_011336 [Arthromyces matolae]|nr:hypothetical protein H0H93_011336 [Arthromyces matolae]
MHKRPNPVLFEKDYEDGHVMSVVDLIAFAKFGAADPQSLFLADPTFIDKLYHLWPYVQQVADALKRRVPKTSKWYTVPTKRKFEDFETYLTNSLWFLKNAIELEFNARERLYTENIEHVAAQHDSLIGIQSALAQVTLEFQASDGNWDLYHNLVVYAKFWGKMRGDAGNDLTQIRRVLEPIVRLLGGELPNLPEGYFFTKYFQEGQKFLENRCTVLPVYEHPPAYNSIHGAGAAHSPQVPPP